MFGNVIRYEFVTCKNKVKRSVNWNDVKSYFEAYVSEFYEIANTKDIVYIGKELPDEYNILVLDINIS